MTNQDERLKGNEKIETAIAALQQEPNDELLAHTLTVIRRRMKEQGQFILAVEPAAAGTQPRTGAPAGSARPWLWLYQGAEHPA